MVMESVVLGIFGALSAKTAPPVLDFLGDQLKKALKGKRGKGRSELDALKQEVETLRRQLESKDTIGSGEIEQVAAQIEKACLVEHQYGLELISEQAHKQWLLNLFEELGNIKSLKSAFKIDIWTQEKSSSTARDINIVPVTSPGSYRIGDKIAFFFRSNRDCYLTVFNLGTSGSITVLFPNKLFQDNFIRAGRTYSIPGEGYPFEYMLSGPVGVERIKAIASLERVNLTDLDFSRKDTVFYSVERSAAAKDIQIVDKRIHELPATGWAAATCEFDVR